MPKDITNKSARSFTNFDCRSWNGSSLLNFMMVLYQLHNAGKTQPSLQDCLKETMLYSVLLQQMLIAFQPNWTDVIVSLSNALTSIVSALMNRCKIQNEQKHLKPTKTVPLAGFRGVLGTFFWETS